MDNELYEQIEKAAEKGVRKNALKHTIITIISIAAIVFACGVFLNSKIEGFSNKIQNAFVQGSVEKHDLVLEDKGLLGYSVVDFEEAILGESKRVTKLEVLEQEVSDVATAEEAGFFKLGLFTKTQCIKYTGTVIYTVDLSKITKQDIKIDEEKHTVTLSIPHAQQGEINIPESKIEIVDASKGLLAFGEMKYTTEQTKQIQAGARAKMEEKLKADRVINKADEFAKHEVWKIYQPLIKRIANDFALEVEFK